MKRIFKTAAWMAMIMLIALAPFLSALLTVSHQELVRRSYDSWSGVLRVWKCEGWQCGSGSLTTWLNACVASFEKSHPGAYIQISDVSAEVLRNFCADEFNPPDAILFAPGLLETPDYLLPISEPACLKPALRSPDAESDARYAVPVAMGGYALAMNNRLLVDTPQDWSDLPSTEYPLLQCPSDGDWLCWSAALLALFAGNSSSLSQEKALAGEGVDLNLPEPSRSPERISLPEEPLRNALPSSLPDAFRRDSSVFNQFSSGTVAAVPVTQRDVSRLLTLSESGKGPDWRVETAGIPFTDQLTFYSIVDYPRNDAEARQSLCADFLSILLSDKMQQKLALVRAFPACSTTGLYSSPAMSALEQALSSEQLITPPAFGSEWRRQASALADALSPGSNTRDAFLTLQNAWFSNG